MRDMFVWEPREVRFTMVMYVPMVRVPAMYDVEVPETPVSARLFLIR